jgi:hypothetical protein
MNIMISSGRRRRPASARSGGAVLMAFGGLFVLMGLFATSKQPLVGVPFLLVGGAIVALGLAAWRKTPADETSNPAVLRANEGLGIGVLAGFALVWNGIAWPMIIVVWSKGDAGKAIWAAALFPLIGIGLVIYALRFAAQMRQLGRAAATLVPRHPTLGAPFDVTLRFVGARTALPTQWRARLTCERVDYSRRGNGSRNVSRRVLWQHEQLLRSDGARVRARLPAGEAGPQQAQAEATTTFDDGDRIEWTLEFTAQGQTAHTRKFSLIVGQYDPQAAPLPPLEPAAAPQIPDAATLRAQLAAQGVHVNDDGQPGGSGQWSFSARRNTGLGWSMLVIGLVFALGGASITSTGAALGALGTKLFGAIFVTVGALMAAGGLLMLTLRTELRWRGARARASWRSLLGSGQEDFDIPYVVRLVPVVGYTSVNGATRTESLSLKAALADGRWVRLAGGVRGRLETQALMARLQTAWRLRADRMVPVEGASRQVTGTDGLLQSLRLRVLAVAVALAIALLGAAIAFPHDYGWRQSQKRAAGHDDVDSATQRVSLAVALSATSRLPR